MDNLANNRLGLDKAILGLDTSIDVKGMVYG
jgi:hypothetical protein